MVITVFLNTSNIEPRTLNPEPKSTEHKKAYCNLPIDLRVNQNKVQ